MHHVLHTTHYPLLTTHCSLLATSQTVEGGGEGGVYGLAVGTEALTQVTAWPPQTLLSLSLSLTLTLTLALTHPVTLAVVLGLTLTLVCSPRA